MPELSLLPTDSSRKLLSLSHCPKTLSRAHGEGWAFWLAEPLLGSTMGSALSAGWCVSPDNRPSASSLQFTGEDRVTWVTGEPIRSHRWLVPS